MASVLVRAEVEKLAGLLGTDGERLSYLEKLSAEEIRELRDCATDRLFDADRGVFDRLAAASGVMPDGLAVSLSQKAFGPLLTARMTGVVAPSTAVSVGRKLPHEFLAEVAVLIDPRRASDVISALPADHVAKTSGLLARREEWIAMGRFVGHLSDDALRATIEDLSDEALLRIAFVMEERDALSRVVAMLSDERLLGTVSAAGDEGLWTEAISLLSDLDDEQLGRILDVLAEADDQLLDDLVTTASSKSLWPELLPLLPAMPQDGLRRFGRLSSVQAPDAVKTIVAVAVEHGLETELLRLLASLDAGDQEAFVEPATALPAVQRKQLRARAKEAALLDELGPLADVI